jgi:hypothetical protein
MYVFPPFDAPLLQPRRTNSGANMKQPFTDLAVALRREGYNTAEIDAATQQVREFRDHLRAERKHQAECARAYIVALENLRLELRAALQLERTL